MSCIIQLYACFKLSKKLSIFLHSIAIITKYSSWIIKKKIKLKDNEVKLTIKLPLRGVKSFPLALCIGAKLEPFFANLV